MYDLSFHDLDSRVKYKEMQVYTASIYSQISIIETKKIRMPVMRISLSLSCFPYKLFTNFLGDSP